MKEINLISRGFNFAGSRIFIDLAWISFCGNLQKPRQPPRSRHSIHAKFYPLIVITYSLVRVAAVVAKLSIVLIGYMLPWNNSWSVNKAFATNEIFRSLFHVHVNVLVTFFKRFFSKERFLWTFPKNIWRISRRYSLTILLFTHFRAKNKKNTRKLVQILHKKGQLHKN